MNIHSFSSHGEFEDHEIQEVENHVRYALRSISEKIEKENGTVIVFVESDKTRFKVIGFSLLLNLQITKLLKERN